MPWTDAQRAAIESRGENLLLSAAAGSGKTTVLVERVLRLIGEGADIGSMLIVTFTRAAAADMRAALVRALEKAALDAPRFRAQAEAAEYAGISTIHAFCIDILREHFQKAEVDPAFRVADSAEAAILFSKAMDQAMNDAYAAASPDLSALAEGRAPGQVRELAGQLYRFILDRPAPFDWLEEAIGRLERGEDAFSPVLVRAAKRPLSDALALVRRAISLCGGREDLEPYYKTALFDEAYIESLLDLDYEPLQRALSDLSFTRLPTARALKEDPDALAFRALRDEARDLAKKAAKKLPLALSEAREDLTGSAREIRALADIVRRADEEFTRLKDERSLLTFGDLEHRALRALEDEGVRAALRERFAYVFVDEYQDVSDIQEAIVNRVAGENNLFCVGDVKQSIYRFRNAEPSLFQEKYARYGRGEGGRLILLRENFRSRGSILGFVNAVFSRAMRGGDSEITYDEAASLRQGAPIEGQDPPVELTLIDRAGDGAEPEDEAARLILDMKDAEVEALVAARRIQELLGAPVWDAKKGAFRPLRYRDFVLLTRQARDVASLMLAVLKREGVPAYADVSGGYLDVVEVRVAVALLRLIENRRRDVEWIAVLRSSVMDMTSEELADLRLAAPEGRFCDAVAARAAKDDALALRLRSLMRRLDRWREESAARPLADFVFGALRESGLYAAAGALPGGAQRQANLDALCDRAGVYEAAQPGGLTGFLRHLEQMETAREDMGEAHVLGENDDVVRVMTVHKSKGLEFPVVFGVMLGRPWNRQASRGELRAHRLLGVGIKHVDNRLGSKRDTIARLAAAEQAAVESEAEELRILYVMLTRAKDRLILIGSAADAQKLVRRAAMSAASPLAPASFLDALLPAALSMPGAEPLGAGLPADPALPRLQARVISRASLSAREEAEGGRAGTLFDEALSALPDEGLLAAYLWRYPYADSVLMPLKLTASGFSRELTGPAEPPELIERPVFLEGDAGLTGAERGTAAHAALRHMDLNALRGLAGDALHAEIVNQLNGMADRALLTPAMREAVRPRMLAAFFAEGPGARMLAAETLRREWMFTLKLTAREALGADSDETILVQGSVDCCFMEEGGWVLLDYKTDRTDDEEALRARYEPQLRLYAAALEKITGAPVKETLICLLRSGRAIRVE